LAKLEAKVEWHVFSGHGVVPHRAQYWQLQAVWCTGDATISRNATTAVCRWWQRWEQLCLVGLEAKLLSCFASMTYK